MIPLLYGFNVVIIGLTAIWHFLSLLPAANKLSQCGPNGQCEKPPPVRVAGDRQANKRTDGRTDKQTDRQTLSSKVHAFLAGA